MHYPHSLDNAWRHQEGGFQECAPNRYIQRVLSCLYHSNFGDSQHWIHNHSHWQNDNRNRYCHCRAYGTSDHSHYAWWSCFYYHYRRRVYHRYRGRPNPHIYPDDYRDVCHRHHTDCPCHSNYKNHRLWWHWDHHSHHDGAVHLGW